MAYSYSKTTYHRLTTIRQSDVIFVVDKGAIVEQGTYEELLQRGELFSRLAKTQEEASASVPPRPIPRDPYSITSRPHRAALHRTVPHLLNRNPSHHPLAPHLHPVAGA